MTTRPVSRSRITWLASRPRWQWMLVGILIGFSIQLTYGAAFRRDLLTTAPVIADQSLFEQMLLQAKDGVPCLREIVVHPYHEPGGAANGYVVTGRFFDAASESGRELRFLAAFPYRAGPALKRVSAFSGKDLSARFAALNNPGILDYFAVLSEGVELDYQYAWWEEPLPRHLVWPLAGLLIIGLLLPTFLCLQAFGRIARPAAPPRSPHEGAVENPTPAPAAQPISACETPEAPRQDSFRMKPKDYYPTDHQNRRTN